MHLGLGVAFKPFKQSDSEQRTEGDVVHGRDHYVVRVSALEFRR
jgi:hypothetical protein